MTPPERSLTPPDREIRRLAGREALRTPWMSVREDDVEFPNGTRGTFSVVDKPDFVVVVPAERDGFWLVEQYRYPIGRRQWEFPQGGWPAGHGGTQHELAVAELREETGLSAGRLTHLGRLAASAGYSSQHFDVYLAEDLTPGDPHREATESDMVHAWRSSAEVRSMITSGAFADAHSVAALALLDLHRAGISP